METWKAIAGFEGRYDVSDLGRVRSWRGGADKSRPDSVRKSKMVRPWVNWNGYHLVTLVGLGKKKHKTVHSLVLEAFVCPRPSPATESSHLDNDRGNNCLSNLEWTTKKENHAHRIATGVRFNKRGGGPRSSFSDDDVRRIKKHLAGGKKTILGLSREYGVSFHAIWRISKGITFKDI